jgi:hypothetical protein
LIGFQSIDEEIKNYTVSVRAHIAIHARKSWAWRKFRKYVSWWGGFEVGQSQLPDGHAYFDHNWSRRQRKPSAEINAKWFQVVWFIAHDE